MIVVRAASGTPEQTEGNAAVVSGEVEKMPVHAVQQVETLQRLLLEGEGVPFLPDGRVDLSRCLWDGGEERSTL